MVSVGPALRSTAANGQGKSDRDDVFHVLYQTRKEEPHDKKEASKANKLCAKRAREMAIERK